MSNYNSWNNHTNNEDKELSELTASQLRMLDDDNQKRLLFSAVRAIRNILHVHRSLVKAKMFGYEGSDVYEVIKNSTTKRCYTYTGVEKDGFFYPLHVAAEAGHKNLCILLVRAGADENALDYRGSTAEERSNGSAKYAFYELRGLIFEATERYQGKADRAGNRHGLGTIFFKPEGYSTVEFPLFRGNFKNGEYHGHGTMYWPGTETIRYVGRFKNGLRHGRGIEFDESGRKVYQGVFRDDKREGRGELFEGGIRTYKGEFAGNCKHGFGVAYYGENAKYFGRFESDFMCGLGIYCHPGGNRFEGMFINNKPDGPGSFYEMDPITGTLKAKHAIWSAGREVKGSNLPFVPSVADLPDYTGKARLNEFLSHAGEVDEGMETGGDADKIAGESIKSSDGNKATGNDDDSVLSTTSIDSNTSSKRVSFLPFNNKPKIASKYKYQKTSSTGNGSTAGGDGRPMGASSVPQLKKTFSYFDEFSSNGKEGGVSKADVWKVQLGKYLRLPLKEAKILGIHIEERVLRELARQKSARKAEAGLNDENLSDTEVTMDVLDDEDEGDVSEKDAAVGEDDDTDVDEITGYHFMESVSLFVAYMYVNTASKVFEERLVNRHGLSAEFPDFEAVYHLVIDAVDSYNDRWENAFRMQEHQRVIEENMDGSTGEGPGSLKQVESRRMVFMTEKQKKEELILRQRAELAIKKGTAELPREVEREIEEEVLKALEAELAKIIADGSTDERTAISSIKFGASPADSANASYVNRPQSSSIGTRSERSNSSSSQKQANSSKQSGKKSNHGSRSKGDPHHHHHRGGSQHQQQQVVNLDDLFDLDGEDLAGRSAAMLGPQQQQLFQQQQQQQKYGGSSGRVNVNADWTEDSEQPPTNEFAAELLYIMRTSMGLDL